MNGAQIATPAFGGVSTLIQTGVPSSLAAASSRLGATRVLRPLSLEWAAGFVDGEGCISVVAQTYKCGRNATHRLVCSITQNNREVLEHLRDCVGIAGRIYNVKRRSFHTKPVYVLNFDGKKAMAFIALLTPHLVRKREEALTAWSYWVEGRVSERFGRKGLPPELRATRERLYLKLRTLK